MLITKEPRPERMFSVRLTQRELEEIRIAFNYVLGQTFYCADQRFRVVEMRDKINEAIL